MAFRGAVERIWLVLTLAFVPFQALGAQVSLGTEDVVLPAGYTIEPVLTGLTYPTSLVFGPNGSLYVAEAGHDLGRSASPQAAARRISWMPSRSDWPACDRLRSSPSIRQKEPPVTGGWRWVVWTKVRPCELLLPNTGRKQTRPASSDKEPV